MLRYVLARLGQSIPVAIGITLVAFGLLNASRGAELAQLGEHASPETVERERRRNGLDLPLLTRYRIYLAGGTYSDGARCSGLWRGDLGRTRLMGEPVSRRVWQAFRVTLRLALGALAVAVAFGIAAGLASALKPRSARDAVCMALATFGVSLPVFWLGGLLQNLFAERLGWLPIVADANLSLRSFLLPSLTLGLVLTAVMARVTRGALLDQIALDYVRAARARGLTRTNAVHKHAFANAFLPVLTVIANHLGSLLAGAVLTERVFQLPGLGRLMADAVFEREFNLLMGALLVVAGLFVFVNLLVDMAYAYLDPRVRYA